MQKYVKEYQWSNIFAMVRNLKREPAVCTDDFKGQLVVITGATSGIGRAAAEKFAAHGADILSVNRNAEKSEALCASIKAAHKVACDFILADFSKLADVHAAGKKLAALKRDVDVLIHNAGAFVTQRTLTEDGLEMIFQTNYLSTFILNHYLKKKFIQQGKGRILFVNSEGHRFAAWGLHMDDLKWEKHRYSGSKSYGAAKLAQLLSMMILDEQLAGSGATVNAMHPGNVKTNSGNENGPLYQFFKKTMVDRSAKTTEISSEALYYLGVSKDVADVSGKFFNLTTIEVPAPPALDREAAAALWEVSLELGGLT